MGWAGWWTGWEEGWWWTDGDWIGRRTGGGWMVDWIGGGLVVGGMVDWMEEDWWWAGLVEVLGG